LDNAIVISHDERRHRVDPVALVKLRLCRYLKLLHGDGAAFEMEGPFPYACAGVARFGREHRDEPWGFWANEVASIE
jgi:hypothetical protein